jgi:DHA2 family multidrug resistance protein
VKPLWFRPLHKYHPHSATIAFALWESSPRNRFPLFDVSLLRDRNVLAAIFIGIFAGMILSGTLFVLPEYLRPVDSQTHSASQTGQLIDFYAFSEAAAIRPMMNKGCRQIWTPKVYRCVTLHADLVNAPVVSMSDYIDT